MATFVIQTRFDAPAFITTVELDGTAYSLKFRFNRLDQRWRMDIEQGGVNLVSGVVVVIEKDLLFPYKTNDLIPQGVLRCVDTSRDLSPPDRNNFGETVLLVYDTASYSGGFEP